RSRCFESGPKALAKYLIMVSLCSTETAWGETIGTFILSISNMRLTATFHLSSVRGPILCHGMCSHPWQPAHSFAIRSRPGPGGIKRIKMHQFDAGGSI